MNHSMNRRDLLKLAGLGVAVFVSGTTVRAGGFRQKKDESFYFVQLSDTHWGYKGPANPEATVELPRAVELVNALPQVPDFVVFTGDLTHTTDDDQERRRRMGQVREHLARLRVPTLRLMAGEHDASLDRGAAFQEFFGPLRYSFDHKGVHFVVLDNVSDPKGILGDAQIDWLSRDLKPRPKDAGTPHSAERATARPGASFIGKPNAAIFRAAQR